MTANGLVGGLDKAELGQRLDAVVKTISWVILAVLNAQHRGAGEVHLPTVAGGSESITKR